MSWHITYVCVVNGQVLQSVCSADFKWDLFEIGIASLLGCGTVLFCWMLIMDLLDRRAKKT